MCSSDLRRRLYIIWFVLAVLLAGVILHEATDIFEPTPTPRAGRLPMFAFREPDLGRVQIVETTYTTLKRANWRIALSHPVIGVGPGQSNTYLPGLKAAGIYPAHLPNYDPHSTWMGAFSETGLVGLATLIAMVAAWQRLR